MGAEQLSGTVLLLQEVAPLFRLLQKGEDFVWTEECHAAFTSVQRALVEALVLAPPDLTLPFVLDTDASSVGSGAVLSQVTPGGKSVGISQQDTQQC